MSDGGFAMVRRTPGWRCWGLFIPGRVDPVFRSRRQYQCCWYSFFAGYGWPGVC